MKVQPDDFDNSAIVTQTIAEKWKQFVSKQNNLFLDNLSWQLINWHVCWINCIILVSLKAKQKKHLKKYFNNK